MKYLAVGICCFFLIKLSGQTLYNAELSKKIDSIVVIDQKWRLIELNLTEDEKKDSAYVESIKRSWQTADSLNLIEAKSIVAKYGFPGFDLVGQTSSNNFWLLIQHADGDIQFQELCLHLLSKQVEIKNASASNYAYLVDRLKVAKNEKQVYGTQMWLNKEQTSFIIPDVIEPEHLNERRQAVGLESIEKYIEQMNDTYKNRLKKEQLPVLKQHSD